MKLTDVFFRMLRKAIEDGYLEHLMSVKTNWWNSPFNRAKNVCEINSVY